ncbi:MAG: PaaI family thioesterase [Halioglobus sp.]
MTKQERIDQLNANTPSFFAMMGGVLVDFDTEEGSCIIEFDISRDFCHSIDIVQGGFVTAMLDASMSHAIFASDPEVTMVSSLDVNTSYLEPTRAGKSKAIGKIVKAHYKTVFLESRVYNEAGVLTAIASSVAKIGRKK